MLEGLAHESLRFAPVSAKRNVLAFAKPCRGAGRHLGPGVKVPLRREAETLAATEVRLPEDQELIVAAGVRVIDLRRWEVEQPGKLVAAAAEIDRVGLRRATPQDDAAGLARRRRSEVQRSVAKVRIAGIATHGERDPIAARGNARAL